MLYFRRIEEIFLKKMSIYRKKTVSLHRNYGDNDVTEGGVKAKKQWRFAAIHG